MDQTFYTYALCDPRKAGVYQYGNITLCFQPFYIGKGHGKRAWAHLRDGRYRRASGNPYKDRLIQKLLAAGSDPVILIINNNLTEDAAFEQEKALILTIGRSNLGTGPLTNINDGGEGNIGYRWTAEQRTRCSERVSGSLNPFFGKHHSAETKQVMKRKHRDTTGVNNTFYGKHHTEEMRSKLSHDRLGISRGPFTAEHRSRIGESQPKDKPKLTPDAKARRANVIRGNFARFGHPHKRTYKICTPKGCATNITNLKQWCREFDLPYSTMCRVSKGLQNSYKGYSCSIIPLEAAVG